MKRIPTIAIIAVGRSGTNYFVSTLKKFDGAAAYFELFGEHGVFGITDYPATAQRLSDIIKQPITKAEDPELSKVFRERPGLHINLLNHCAMQEGHQWMSYKVFPDQVDPYKLKHSLKEENTKVLFLTRNRLETYISLQKALAKGEWMNIETSDLRPKINATAFLRWAERQNAWYTDLHEYAVNEGLSFEIVNYETQINVSQQSLLQTCAGLMQRFGIDARYPQDAAGHLEFTKQDKTECPFDRIANGAELRAELLSLGRLDDALKSPLAGETQPLSPAV